MTTDEIKDMYSMREIVERYGFQLNRAGFIPCPYHDGDREPSLKVYDKDFYCHACNEKGDIFDFVEKMEGISFKEAYQQLGGLYQKNTKQTRMRYAQIKRERQEKVAKEADFRIWRMLEISECCRLIRMLEQLERLSEPLSDIWGEIINQKQLLEYKYQILANGSREDQEEVRGL